MDKKTGTLTSAQLDRATGVLLGLVIGFAVAVVVFNISASREPDGPRIMETLFAIRSANKIAHEVQPYFKTSHLKIMAERWLEESRVSLNPGYLDEFDNLHDVVKSCDVPYDVRETCLLEYRNLRQWLIHTAGFPRSWMHFLSWAGSLDDKFLALLSFKEPLAVVIFVYWCAIMGNSPRKWFLDGWAARLASYAMEPLGLAWQPILDWPRNHLGLGNSVENFISPPVD